MKIKKRDGSIVAFNKEKIAAAITKAFEAQTGAADPVTVNYLTEQVVKKVPARGATVEGVQDLVVRAIQEAGYYDVATAYTVYRYKRELARKANTTDGTILSLLRNENKELAEENSNKSTRIASTQRDYIAGVVSRDLTDRILLPEKISKAHEEGILHFHDSDYFIQPIFNCFSSSTKFVTDKGVVAFSECQDGEPVRVLDKDGVWRKATVHKYGTQKLYDVSMHSGRSKKTVVCSRDHRWVLADGTVTTDLQVGDSLYALQDSSAQWEPETLRDFEMFAFGMVIGDGNDTHRGLHITLCGDKRKFMDVFQKAGYHINDSAKDGYVRAELKTKMSKQKFLTARGWLYLSQRDKAMLFKGLYAADGSNDRHLIATADERVLELITDISAIAGYHISSVKELIRDTNFKEDAKIYEVRFRIRQNCKNCWKIDAIKPHERGTKEHDIWCVEEPVTHTFTLDGGVVTGNCCLINIGDMLDNGTVMNDKMIETPKSFQVACTVVTQIIACIASNQYGGQSVDMGHLGKYLRKSRDKFARRLAENCPELGEEEREKLVMLQLKEELKAGVQTIQYQINTLMTTNGF